MTKIPSNKYHKMLDHDHALRLIIVGDYNTGKTTFLNTYIRQERTKTTYEPTIGIDFSSRNIVSNSGETIKLACWDTSGQETFKSIVRSYYRDICGVFLVFDVTNRRSFIHLQGWIDDIYRNSSCKMHKHPILLLGNKIDKITENGRHVTRDEALLFANKNELQYVETSALTGENLDMVIPQFADHIMQVCGNTKCKGIKSRFNPNITPLDVEHVSIEPRNEKSPSEKTCCHIS